MISQALVDYTDMGRTIGRLLDDVQEPYVSANNSDGTITSYSHTSMVVHPGSNDHLRIRNLIHGNMLSSSLKEQQNRKVSLENVILGVDYKMTIKMLKNIYTLMYDTFISLIKSFLGTFTELSTSQPKQ